MTALLALTVLLVVWNDGLVFALVTGVAASILFVLLQRTVEDERFRRYWTTPVFHRNEPVRVSMSYLVLVRADDDLLLVSSTRFQQFQPVGGVYKYFADARAELQRCDYEADPLIASDPSSHLDLRLVVPGRHLLRFLRWFDVGRDREQGPWREFHEELISPGHLDIDVFGDAQFRYLGRRYNPLRRTTYVGNMREVLVADVFELMPNDRQLEALRSLRTNSPADLLWLDRTAAQRRGAGAVATGPVPSVAEHVGWMLDHSALA